jgi:hypothetical protein
MSRRQFLKFVVNQGNDRMQGLLIAGADALEEFRDLHRP